MSEPRSPEQQWFLTYADECYVVTRVCYFAFLTSTVFRMAHHAIEYYLKAALATSMTLSELKRRRHDLVDLCNDFEQRCGDLARFRPMIVYIDQFERMRYPRMESFTHVLWGSRFTDFVKRFPEPEIQARVAWFHVADFDALVHHLRSTTVSEQWPVSAPSDLAQEYLFKENACFKSTTHAA